MIAHHRASPKFVIERAGDALLGAELGQRADEDEHARRSQHRLAGAQEPASAGQQRLPGGERGQHAATAGAAGRATLATSIGWRRIQLTRRSASRTRIARSAAEHEPDRAVDRSRGGHQPRREARLDDVDRVHHQEHQRQDDHQAWTSWPRTVRVSRSTIVAGRPGRRHLPRGRVSGRPLRWPGEDRPGHVLSPARPRPRRLPARRSVGACAAPTWRSRSGTTRPSCGAGFDLVVIRSTWDYAQRRGEFVAWAQRVAQMTRLSNPFPVIRWNTDKHYLAELEAAGVPVVPTIWLEPELHLSGRALHTRFPAGGDFVIKPAVSAGSLRHRPLHRDQRVLARAGHPARQAAARRRAHRDDPAVPPQRRHRGRARAHLHLRRVLPLDPQGRDPRRPRRGSRGHLPRGADQLDLRRRRRDRAGARTVGARSRAGC